MAEEIKIPKVSIPQAKVDETAFDRQDLQRLRLFLYFIPIVGIFPAFWSLYRKDQQPNPSKPMARTQGSPEKQRDRAASQLSIKLTGIWLIALFLVNTGGAVTEMPQLPLLVLSSLVTSGYFVSNVWLMRQFSQRQNSRS